jgi:hypothetical protein
MNSIGWRQGHGGLGPVVSELFRVRGDQGGDMRAAFLLLVRKHRSVDCVTSPVFVLLCNYCNPSNPDISFSLSKLAASGSACIT